jgi:hypothetical protein
MTITALDFLYSNDGTATLCGSTRFFFEAMEANRRLTHLNWLVFQCGNWGHSFHKYRENGGDYQSVKRLHFHKIYQSDIVVVVTDVTSYIGKSTNLEIEYADYLEKPILTFDGDKFGGEPPEHFRCNRRVINDSIQVYLDSRNITL